MTVSKSHVELPENANLKAHPLGNTPMGEHDMRWNEVICYVVVFCHVSNIFDISV